MNLKLSRIKNLCILGLTVLAVYQTSRLWFEDDLSRNFFYSFLRSADSGADAGDEYAFVMPYRSLTNYGGNKFHVQYFSVLHEDFLSDISQDPKRLAGYEAQNSQRKKMDEIIRSVLGEGEYQGAFSLDYATVLMERSLIYEYPFLMDSAYFAETFPYKLSMPNTAYKFNMIAAVPDSASSSLMKLFFINSLENTYYEYHLESISLCDELSKMIQDIQRTNLYEGVYYVSSKLLKINSEYNFFFPRWERESMTYPLTRIVTSYYENNDPRKPQIQERISWLFDNPSSVIDSVTGGVYTFSDTNTVVKYSLGNDVLEYRNYKIRAQETSTSVFEDYAKALGIIRRDNEVYQDFYLADFQEDDGGNVRIFHFNYIIDNFPMVLQDTNGEEGETERTYAMTVEIENNTVRRYTKLAYSFDTSSPKMVNTGMDILGFIDEGGMDSSAIKTMLVGYFSPTMAGRDDEDAYIRLYLIITTTSDRYLTWFITDR